MNTYTVSEARKNLYDLVRSAAKGLNSYEIKLRGEEDSVILLSRAEVEAWQETLDILGDREEIKAVRKAKKEKKVISHNQLLKELGFDK